MPRVTGGNAPQQPRPVSNQPVRNNQAPPANNRTQSKPRSVQNQPAPPPAQNTGKRVNIVV